jgi:hypothetical protein
MTTPITSKDQQVITQKALELLPLYNEINLKRVDESLAKDKIAKAEAALAKAKNDLVQAENITKQAQDDFDAKVEAAFTDGRIGITKENFQRLVAGFAETFSQITRDYVPTDAPEPSEETTAATEQSITASAPVSEQLAPAPEQTPSAAAPEKPPRGRPGRKPKTAAPTPEAPPATAAEEAPANVTETVASLTETAATEAQEPQSKPRGRGRPKTKPALAAVAPESEASASGEASDADNAPAATRKPKKTKEPAAPKKVKAAAVQKDASTDETVRKGGRPKLDDSRKLAEFVEGFAEGVVMGQANPDAETAPTETQRGKRHNGIIAGFASTRDPNAPQTAEEAYAAHTTKVEKDKKLPLSQRASNKSGKQNAKAAPSTPAIPVEPINEASGVPDINVGEFPDHKDHVELNALIEVMKQTPPPAPAPAQDEENIRFINSDEGETLQMQMVSSVAIATDDELENETPPFMR